MTKSQHPTTESIKDARTNGTANLATPRWTPRELARIAAFDREEQEGGRRNWVALRRAFPNRSEQSIRSKLNAIARAREVVPGKKMKWSLADDQYLIRHYAKVGPARVGEALGRTKAAVTTRACLLGVTLPARAMASSDG